MLRDKLQQANRETRRRRQRFALALLGAILVLALFVIGVIRIDLVQLGLVQETNLMPPAPLQPPEKRPAATRATTSPAGQVSSAPILTQAPAIAASTSLPSAEDNAAGSSAMLYERKRETENLAARNRFKDALAKFQREIEPMIAEPDFANWDRTLQDAIPSRKAEAIRRFGAGDYTGAEQTLAAAMQIARDALAARDRAFDEALSASRVAADNDEYEQAAREIDKALGLRAGSVEALALKQRIDGLPTILDLIRRAAVSRTENDQETEEALLAETVAADPARIGLAERLATVRSNLRELRFSRHIEVGFTAVGRRDVTAARRALTAANAVAPARSEAKLLSRQIATLARDIEAARLMDKAGAAAGSDDWTAAQSYYEKAANILPDDKQALAGRDLAQAINALHSQIVKHLAAPFRLSSPNVAAQAAALLADAEAPAALSPLLASKRKALSSALSTHTATVPVQIVSDGHTRISVRGVGHVGVTTGRTIALRPGRYTFEGVRPGFKSKLISVRISPRAAGFTVKIACDEPV